MRSRLLRDFDLNSPTPGPTPPIEVKRRGMLPKPGTESDHSSAAVLSVTEQLFMYAGTVIGVIFSSGVTQFGRTANPFASIGWRTVLLSAIVSLIVIPRIYEKLKVQPNTPFLIRFGLFVQHGVFWNVLFDAAAAAID